MIINSKNKFAHVIFDNSEKKESATLAIEDKRIKLTSTSGKWYTNIPVNGKDVVLEKSSSEFCKLIFSDYKIYHPDQKAFDEKQKIEPHILEGNEVYYSLTKNTDNPKKLLVTFPGVSGFDNIHYRLSALTSLQPRIKDCLVLAFQDKYGVYGNYMYETENSYPVKPIVISLISGISARYGISEKDIVFYGNSKGGSIALDYIDEYEDSYFFIDIPQLYLPDYQAQNDIMKYCLSTENQRRYSFIEKIKKIKNKNIFYSFAEMDFDSSRGIPLKELSGVNSLMLKDSEHSGAAMELIKRQFPKIIQKVTGSEPIVRDTIDARIEYKSNYIFLTRVLSSFKSEKDLKKVFTEVEFYNSDFSYSVSLNQRFDEKIILYWKNGFDIKKHLADGLYSLKIHVYFNDKEFIYPLSKKIMIADDGIVVT